MSGHLGAKLGMRLPALALAGFTALALASAAQLGDCHCLIELGDRAEHLPHQLGRGRVVDGRRLRPVTASWVAKR